MPARSKARAGFSLLEILIVATILALLATAMVESSSSMGLITSTGNVRSTLQLEGEKALRSIVDDLRDSGEVVLLVGGVALSYPHVFEDGLAGPGFEAHTHAVHSTQAVNGDPDFGPSQEIVLVLPADDDGDEVPDLTAANELVWGASEISYTVLTTGDGSNVLQRRVDTVDPRNICRGVERIVFNTHASSGFVLPLRSVRVQVFLRALGPDGETHRHEVEATVRLRNSETSL